MRGQLNKYVIASTRALHNGMAERLTKATGREFSCVSSDLELTNDSVMGVKYIFFPHWSHFIPAWLFNSVECVVFHMTDLPFGRGGSPLQNLIARGIYETKISAFRCTKDLDCGPIYAKRPLSLHGTAGEIYARTAEIIESMICEMAENEPTPTPQQGDAVFFKRRQLSDGDISELTDLRQVYDYIRMLDADDYPKAFLEVGDFRYEFQRASLRDGKVVADVVITKRNRT